MNRLKLTSLVSLSFVLTCLNLKNAQAGFVLNDPVNFIDSVGLSAADVNQINSVFNSTLAKWTSMGLRSSFGPWTNFSRSMGDLTGGLIGNCSYLGCYEQAYGMQQILQSRKYDDTWTFKNMSGINHHWLEGHSSNPSDPVLTIDPWWGSVSEKVCK